ncbi:MAG: hypothetical protein J6Z30_05040, partial [Pyramidobacter sp.]|nr:hypothetical protein [Pyramidobacter sp.]
AVYAEQAGDSRIDLYVEGVRLPQPQILFRGDESVVLTFRKTAFPAQRWQKTLHAPLAPFAEAEQAGEDAVVQVFCEAPLELTNVKNSGQRLRLSFQKKRSPHTGRSVRNRTDRGEPPVSLQRVTIDVTDMSLAEALRLLGAYANVNIVTDASVPRDTTITLSFHDAPFQEVFDYILRVHGLEYIRVGKTVAVGSRGTAGVLAGKLITKSYPIAYADCGKCAAMLRELAELNSPANKVVVDERRRVLIVRAASRQHERVRRVLQEIDSPGVQVTFKARIIEVSEDASDELEGAVNAVYKWWWGSSQGGALAMGGARYSQRGTSSGLPNLDTADLPGTIGSGIVDLAGTAARMLDARISLLVQKSVAKVLASPTVAVLDGEKATIKLVEKLKYVSRRDDARNPTYGDEEVGPRLEVSVRVGRDGVITVGVSLATGEVTQWIRGAQGEQIPQVNSRSVETKVRVRNGEPFVIGGLFKETTSRLRKGVPVLSEIPLLGALFSTRQTKKTRSQVVMILIPSILTVEDLAIPEKILYN